MPGLEHDGLIEFFRRDPLLAVDLARLSGCALPEHDEVRVASGTVGAVASSHNADVLLVFTLAGRVVLVIIVEVQRKPDEDKGFTWPLYTAWAGAHYRCPVVLLVYPTTSDTARWARDELAFLTMSGRPCHPDDRPVVIDPAGLPSLTPEEATIRPYLAAISAAAHANGANGLRAIRVALDASEQLPADTSVIVRDTILAALNDATRAIFLRDPDMQNYVLQSEVMRQWQADSIAKGREAGLEAGREAGLEAGREALRRSLFAAFRLRQLPHDEASRQRIAGSADIEQLERWLERAIAGASIDDIFVD